MQQTTRGVSGVARAVTTTHEAEFAVSSNITVREEYKVKLRALLSSIAPTSWTETLVRQPNCTVFTKSNQQKTTRTGYQSPDVVKGKEIHILGDLLLLTRAASVDVVENIEIWRKIVHDGIPQPYIYKRENYLLSMCEDLDFLDQVGDLVEWLGFGLLRNPFIVDRALDDIVSSRLQIIVHEDRSLKYWSSGSWRQNKRLANKKDTALSSLKPVEPQLTSVCKTHWKKYTPPQPLVKPLVGISPEDEVVSGSRTVAAQQILLDEESLHGRMQALKAVEEYVGRGPSVFEHNSVDKNAESPVVYEVIAALNSLQKTAEYRSSLLRRERAQVERTLQDLRNQMRWAELKRECDLTEDPYIRGCREKYRQKTLSYIATLVEKMEQCLVVLKGEENHFDQALETCKYRMNELRMEKEKLRMTRQNKKKEEEAVRREGICKKTEERSVMLRSKKRKPQMLHQACPESDPEVTRNTLYGDITADIESDIHVIIKKESRVPELNRETLNLQLEEKRQRMVYLKRARIEQQARIAKENKHMVNSRRAENVAMKYEDTVSRLTEREAKRKAQLRAQKELMNRVASCAMFKCVHEMNGKRFLISVHTRNPRGYDLEGLRIIAYDPISSATFTLIMTLREFNSLGYGCTSEGLGTFCKWLCLLYEKRRRQFRLVWSGASCPRPLRIRENDQTLVCLHKEGMKMRSSATNSYLLVAVYVRTDDRSSVRFVVGLWRNHDYLLTEHEVAARCLVIGSELDVQWRSTDHAVIVWKHHEGTFKNEEKEITITFPTTDIGQRIYSSEVIVNRIRYAVHMYDTSDTEYTVELIPKPRKGDAVQQVISSSVNKLTLYKRTVNPYNVHLSSSNFADLLSLIRFEQTPLLEPTKESSQAFHFKWKATISPKWAEKLANYVRVLRLAKYACKISGVFCFIAVFIVQQKTEFRAHLLFEITWLRPTLSSQFSLGGLPTRQSLRITLSDYLRCSNALRRFAAGLANSEDEECPSCLAYTNARTELFEHPVPETSPEHLSSCSNCAIIQHRRLHAVKELIIHAGAIAPEALEVIYHGYCERRAALLPPIIIVVASTMSSSMIMWLLPLLEHYFASFDCSKNGFLHFENDGHTVSEEGIHARETLLHVLARDQVAVLFNANCGVTVENANVFVHELHWWLYPDNHDLPCHVAYIVGDNNDVSRDSRDNDLLEALQSLNHAACQIAELDPVCLDDSDSESDRASAFDAYLVAEAVLVEATRVLLHPEYSWQKPREIIGASSWSSACSFLLDPAQLSGYLVQCNPLKLSVKTVEVLEAYFAHAKWPRDYLDVRPVFFGLLAFMMHLQHVRRILASRSGSLHNSLHLTAQDGIVVEREQLAKNTSVIDCSHVAETPPC